MNFKLLHVIYTRILIKKKKKSKLQLKNIFSKYIIIISKLINVILVPIITFRIFFFGKNQQCWPMVFTMM